MADRIIGSLLHDHHPIPKKSRALKERLKVPVAIGLVLIFIGGVAYKFANFREEGRVREFVGEIAAGRFEAAYQQWDADEHYTMKNFLEDWGREGYYTQGMKEARVIDSNSKGLGVIVYLAIDSLKYPVALQVNKETLKLSFSPESKYRSP